MIEQRKHHLKTNDLGIRPIWHYSVVTVVTVIMIQKVMSATEIDNRGIRRLKTKLYDKRDDFPFPIVNFPFISSIIPRTPSYGVYISQLISSQWLLDLDLTSYSVQYRWERHWPECKCTGPKEIWPFIWIIRN